MHILLEGANSMVIFLPDVSDVRRWPNPVKTQNVPFLLQNPQWNQRMNSSWTMYITKGKIFNFFILHGACQNCYGNLHWSLEKKKTKTQYHAKIDIFLIDSEQIKYLEHFKIKIISCKRKSNKWFHCVNQNEFCIHRY